MIFTNSRSFLSTQKSLNISFTPKTKPMNNKISQHVPKNVKIVKPKTYIEELNNVARSKKIVWGEPFWNLFHVLAEKVIDVNFSKIRVDFLNIIYTICSNLPCPDCTNHAIIYLNSINFNQIKSKADLKNMLWSFHNEVNKKKGFPMFPRDELENKYQQANTIHIIEQFLFFFRRRNTGNIHLLADNLYKERINKTILKWFKENLHNFE